MNAMLPRAISLLFAVAAAGSLICAMGFDISNRNRPSVGQTAGFIAEVDDSIAKLPDTDVLVRLENLPATADRFMQMLYYRGNFTAYPHRVLMNDPRIPMDYRHDHPSAFHFNPTVPWMRDHHIGGEITLGVDDHGQFSSSVQRIPTDGR